MQNVKQNNPNDLDQQLINAIRNVGGDVTLLGIQDPQQLQLRIYQKQISKEDQQWEKQKEALLKNYNDISGASNQALDQLESFHQAYKSTPDIAKGPIFGKLSKLSPDAQAAIKNSAAMILARTQGLKGFSRVTNRDLTMMANASPNMELSPEAEERIYNEIKLAVLRSRVEAQTANKLATYINNPSIIDAVINYAGQTYDTIDENGTLHPESLSMIAKYASPRAAIAIGNGKNYLPESIKDIGIPGGEIEKMALQKGIPLGIAIQRIRQNLALRQKTNAKR